MLLVGEKLWFVTEALIGYENDPGFRHQSGWLLLS